MPLGARAQNGGDILGNILNQVTRGGNGAGAGVTGQAPSPPGARGAQLNQNDIGLGLKDALKIATQRTVGRVGKNDGYNADPAIRIPLPGPLQQADNALRAVGGGFVLDDLRVKMNRAAEQAAPKALNIIVDAASQM